MRAILAALGLATALIAQAAPESFDIVIAGGRVVDPETGLDAVRNVGVRGDRIVMVSAEPLTGVRTIDAHGLIVAPGFIDLHQHQQDDKAYRLKALDGVTTALEWFSPAFTDTSEKPDNANRGVSWEVVERTARSLSTKPCSWPARPA